MDLLASPERLTAAIFVGVGALLLLIAVFVAERTRRFIERAFTATGTVVGHTESHGEDGTSYHPRVVFTAGDGRSVEFVDRIGSNPPRPRAGATVAVRYDPQRPYSARIGTGFRLWFVPVFLGGLGLAFLIVAAVMAA